MGWRRIIYCLQLLYIKKTCDIVISMCYNAVTRLTCLTCGVFVDIFQPSKFQRSRPLACEGTRWRVPFSGVRYSEPTKGPERPCAVRPGRYPLETVTTLRAAFYTAKTQQPYIIVYCKPRATLRGAFSFSPWVAKPGSPVAQYQHGKRRAENTTSSAAARHAHDRACRCACR